MAKLTFLQLFFLFLGSQASFLTPWESDVTEWKLDDLQDGPCKTDLQEYITALTSIASGNNENTWALQMLDSSAKVPNGLLVFNLIHIGMFDECLAVQHPSGRFQGKHCMLSLDLMSIEGSAKQSPKKPMIFDMYFPKAEEPKKPSNRQLMGGGTVLKYGICVPSTCSASDLKQIIGQNNKITAIDENCWTSEERELSDLAIAFISVCAVLAFLTGLSSCYHFICISRNKKPIRLLCAFSLYENVPKLLEIRRNDADNMGCLHGIRTLSMAWVLLCHTFMLLLSSPVINTNDLPNLMVDYEHVVISNGFVSVDSFFFLSGLLVAFVFFRNIGKTGSYDAPSSYIHRFIRLTPPFAMMIFASVSLLPYTGFGPLWHDLITPQVDGCKDNWWSTLLYVQNYVKQEGQCLGQSWYLSADMQMFWIAPFILYPILLWPTYGMILLGLLTIASTLWTFGFAYDKDYKANIMLITDVNQFKYDYIATHTRIMPWLVGLACGVGICAIKARKIQVRLTKIVVLLGWCCTTALCLGIIFSIHRFQTDPETPSVESALYLSFTRLGWGIGLTWIVFACIYGYGGLINSFLSMGFWQPLGKLSYAVYLIHMTMLTYKAAVSRTNIVFSDLNAVYEFCATLFLSYLIAFILYVTVEAPFVIMDQEILGSVHIFQFPKPKESKNTQGKKNEIENQEPVVSVEKIA